MVSPQSFSSDLSPQSSLKSHTRLASTHTLLLHLNMLSGHPRSGSAKESSFCFNRCRLAWQKRQKHKNGGGLPGKEQFVKLTSSMATRPGWLMSLRASNRMVKSWGVLPIRTSLCCHESPWLPDSHHSVLVLELPFRITPSLESVKSCMHLLLFQEDYLFI